MGLAEDHFRILNLYLAKGRKPTKQEYERSKQHGIPLGFNAGNSMNWWVLATGVRFAYGDFSELPSVLERLNKEATEWGVWGSEQHSPVYWAFHLVGRIVIYSTLYAKNDGVRVRELILEDVADFLKGYCHLALDSSGKFIHPCGMRGCGHNETESYELWWVYKTYILQQSTKKKIYWSKQPEIYGWMTAAATRNFMPEVRSTHTQYKPIRSPTHFVGFVNGDMLIWTEDSQHPSTEMIGASGYIHGKRIIAPVNHYVRGRGLGASGYMDCSFNFDLMTLLLRYYGPYNSLRKGNPIVYNGAIPEISYHFVWDRDGMRLLPNPHSVIPPVHPGSGSTDEAEGKKNIWGRLKDVAKNWFK